jgi:Flp pilus assembly protein CpaB
VVVARHPIAAGVSIAATDVRLVRWPRAVAPPKCFHSMREVRGHRTAGPVLAGEPITPARLVGRDLLAGLAAGLRAVPLAVTDPHVDEFVSVGNRVDVYPAVDDSPGITSDPAPRSAVVTGALVLATLPPRPSGDGGVPASSATLVVAVRQTDVARIARASSSQMFAVVLDSP